MSQFLERIGFFLCISTFWASICMVPFVQAPGVLSLPSFAELQYRYPQLARLPNVGEILRRAAARIPGRQSPSRFGGSRYRHPNSGESSDPDLKSKRAELLRKAGQVLPGHLYRDRGGNLMIAIGPNEVFAMPTIHYLDNHIKPYMIYITDPNLFWDNVVRINPNSNKKFDKDRVIAMAKLLHNRVLPCHYKHCNGKHWEMFILYGEPQKTDNCRCPLAADSSGATATDIYKNKLQFVDGWGNVQPIPTQKQYEIGGKRVWGF